MKLLLKGETTYFKISIPKLLSNPTTSLTTPLYPFNLYQCQTNPKTSQTSTKMQKCPRIISQTNFENPAVPFIQRNARRNSLEGLQQYDNEQFGRGKRQRIPKTRADAGIADVEESLDVEETFDAEEALSQKWKVFGDQGGVMRDDEELYEMENALV